MYSLNYTCSLIILCIFILIVINSRWFFKFKSRLTKPEFYSVCDFAEFKQFDNNFKGLKKEFHQISKKINDAPRNNRYGAGEQYKEQTLQYLNSIKDIEGWIYVENNPGWVNFPLYANGVEFKNNLKQVPLLAKLIEENKSIINICGYSKLLAKSHIPAHSDDVGIIYNTMGYHLGLDVSDNNTLTVNGKIKKQEEGKSIMFDSTYKHSANNNSDKDRTILYMEVKV